MEKEKKFKDEKKVKEWRRKVKKIKVGRKREGGKIGKKIMTGERKRGCEIRGWKEEISEEKMKKNGKQ